MCEAGELLLFSHPLPSFVSGLLLYLQLLYFVFCTHRFLQFASV